MNNIQQTQSSFQKTDLQIISDLQTEISKCQPKDRNKLFSSAIAETKNEAVKGWLVEFRGIFNALEVQR